MKQVLLFDDNIEVNVEECIQVKRKEITVYTVVVADNVNLDLLILVLDREQYGYTIITDYVVVFVI